MLIQSIKLKLLFFLFSFVITVQSYAQDYKAIQIDLEKIAQENIEIRNQVVPTMRKYGYASFKMDSLNTEIQKFDSMALSKATFIIDTYGWLGKDKIGDTANQALFTIIQHAQDKEIRMKYFPLLESSALKGESELWEMASMKDRMLVENGEKQLYGTQSKLVDGKVELYPVEDAENLNKRRRKVGIKKMKSSEIKEILLNN
ncbi:hypothetical protein KMW28_26435 [Flammeovirga yaeyamensis]|uniref:Uncharacterized protein n=1 Tax=Flammeovirga yaeyamensis TaxID=367791 RepID=A0AAX1NDD6_9BACT|nr:DUF6624 domain-containing protein [Flammeovirga yaeyamensis]MBB3699158.1 hypothetical protein [Flammeovirga yaeyamensis]NMF35578.1 hypothetical protein [Flammeovirga yaeyamensis]QWG04436.1 hypothetical protein KMW28_26435 [Flammeovirga yaeyamensis]